ncbi:hypothetical protein TraAM80_08461 [Trypanosoma rangeli]|uniref:Uncharacterized protein n=1 Tax=Trypanosoma rangeli TaxID=5698 RepID=A0A3R7KEQ8_TRYRA|nr:uncharacterized protein TraAM80_08461 [Trypanosoma rangeli]RNE98998.1 hypothetical protein TraAM80_08461 [Trypanosoma rangeli]|eukprot:RNE98998.1 hypothetical protein TraAM80_08461 [Trypanosoma rangeli]
MGQQEVWDVTYILPRGNKAVYRQVPLYNMNDLCELTREVVITSLKTQHKNILHRSESDEECVSPEFLVYHVPPKGQGHLCPMLLSRGGNSWDSLLQRQADASQIILQLISRKSQAKGDNTLPAMVRVSTSNSSLLEDTKAQQPSLCHVDNAVITEEKDRDVVPLLLRGDGSPVDAEVTHVSSYSVELKSMNPQLRAALARLRERVGSWPHLRSRLSPLPQDSYTLESGVASTVGVFALTYVFRYVENVRRGRDAGGLNMMDKLPSSFMSRSELVYFAAAAVKIWKSQLVLSFAAMNKKWIELPSSLRNARCDCLRILVCELWSRLSDANQLEQNGYKKPTKESLSLLKENQCGMFFTCNEKNTERVEADAALLLIEEVTYCSSTGPLSVPMGNPRRGGLLVSLRAPKYICLHEEIVIVGCMHSRNSIGLFWWLVDLGPCADSLEMTNREGNSSVILPLDALYLQRRIATYQITPSTFVLIMQPGLILSSRRYQCVVEAYNARTGDVAVSEVSFDSPPTEAPH